MAETTILIVDDEPAVCKVISRVLTSKGLNSDMVHTGTDALDMLSKKRYDAVVLDVKMDDMDGFEVLERIRNGNIDVPVIILSANNENYAMLLGLESGADDYVTKPFDPMFLVAKIQALLRRESRHSAETRCGVLRYNTSKKRLFRDNDEIPLSGKEHAIMQLFMENPGRVFSKSELYRLVWLDGKEGEKCDDNTVMVHINRLRGKIEDDPRNPRYILTVWGTGYKFAEK